MEEHKTNKEKTNNKIFFKCEKNKMVIFSTMVSKSMKHLEINLTKKMMGLNNENYIPLMKEIKENKNK